MKYLTSISTCISATIWLSMYALSVASNHLIDFDRGILTHYQGDAYLYEGKIFVPVKYHIPTEVIAPIGILMDPGNCGVVEYLDEKMKSVIATIESKIPNLSQLQTRRTMKDLILTNGTLSFGKGSDKRVSSSVAQRAHTRKQIWNALKISKPDMLKVSTLNWDHSVLDAKARAMTALRKKRFAPALAIGAAATLIAIAGSISWNRYDIEKLDSNMKLLNENEQLLQNQMKGTATTVNLLIKDHERVTLLTSALSTQMQKILENQNCEIGNHEAALSFINDWTTIVPNSFVRALNGALLGQITVDLLPGDYLQNILEFYPDFSDTIYEKEPHMLYRSGEALFIKVDRTPPSLEVILSIPRIMRTPFGHVVKRESCHWNETINGKNHSVTISENSRAIKSIEGNSIWKTEGCSTMNGQTLCDKSSLISSTSICEQSLANNSSYHCPIKIEDRREDQELIQIPDGILLCPNSHNILLETRDSIGILHTSLVSSNTSRFLTYRDGESVISHRKRYHLLSHTKEIDIMPEYYMNFSLNTLPNMTSIIDSMKPIHIDLLPEIPEVKSIKTHSGVQYILIFSLLVLLAIFGYLIRKHYQRHNLMIGHLYNITNRKGQNEGMELEAAKIRVPEVIKLI